jgi:CheY-like chemotaxis protein
MMPRLDGFGATGEIRQFESTRPDRPRVPIIALTASALQGERERCLAAGMDDFLPKPLPLNELRSMLSHWLSGGSLAPGRNGASAGAPPAPVAPALDEATVEQLKRLTSGDGRTLLAKLIVVFTTDTVRRLEALSVAIQRNNASEVGLIAHTLKSASATLGALYLSSLFATLETAASTTGPDHWSRLEVAIREEYARALAALEATSVEAMAHA